jgi:hypothetical protein
MATVVAGFLSSWPLGWISATTRLLGVDCGHPQWPDLCIFFSWCAGSPERETWPLRVAGSLPLAVGVDRGHPQWSDLSFSFFFFWFAGNVVGGGRLVAALLAGGGRWIFFVA